MPPASKPTPIPSVESRPYWDALKQHRLVMPRCAACGRHWFPPSLLCPHCNARDFAWSDMSGRGKVFSYVVVHRVYHPGFAGEVPYVVALIELAEGPRMLTNLPGAPCDPARLKIGAPLTVAFEQRGDMTLPQFCLASGS